MPYDEVMKKYKSGTLKSVSGKAVNSQRQAVAIMLDEKRKSAAGKKEYQPKPGTPAFKGAAPPFASKSGKKK